MTKKKKILFITPYPFDAAGSQRFRFEQYFSELRSRNFEIEINPFWEQKAWSILYKKGQQWKKSYYLLKGLLRRFFLLFTLNKYDYVFVHREFFPSGPNIFLKKLGRTKAKLIYDFDDAIWLPNFAQSNKRFAFLKNYNQVPTLCEIANTCSVGNQYLADYAKQYNDSITINPTTIDTEGYHKGTIDYSFDKIRFGWTGTHSTMKYLSDLLPVMDRLKEHFDFTMCVISDKPPVFERSYVDFVPWRKESEIEDLKQFHVGVMPLQDDQWAKGKCGFKALQYMSVGMPALVSPVGVNTEIVDNELNGFICGHESEWEVAMRKFLESPELVVKMGGAARKKIEDHYSVKSNTENFIQLFN
jgi:glycosyltransferase involved in cell wall biosynthesis